MKARRFDRTTELLEFDGERVVTCDGCGAFFSRVHYWSDKPRRTCPGCGAAGPFRRPTDADFTAYVERTRDRPADYFKALALMIVLAGIVVIITKWVVDA